MPVPLVRKDGLSFFNQSFGASTTKKVADAAFIDVGGHGDCGFRSVAAAIIDNFLTYPRQRNNELLNQLLNAYYQYFPQYRSQLPGLTTPADRMQQFINRMPMAECIQTMAYVLRQMAVTELCSKPWLYRGAFVDEHENTSPESMRKSGTWIDESAIAALANALSIPIEVRVVERCKTLPLCRHYHFTDDKQSAPVVIQLEGCHYQPRITSIDRFSSPGIQTNRNIEPVQNTVTDDPMMPEILAKIAKEDERLVKSFEDRYRQLSLMVDAQELDLEKLLSIYVKGMNQSDYLSGRVACVTVEHGNQTFFDAILRAQRGAFSLEGATETQSKAITHELIHAIARALSIGQMSKEKVFSEIEANQSVALTQISR